MKVKVGSIYTYDPCNWDMLDPKTCLEQGDKVRIFNKPGCPKANTMGHCHVEDPNTKEFYGLVSCNSLTK